MYADSELCAPVMSIIVALAPVFAVEPAHRYVNSRVLEELYRGATSPDTAESRLFAATVQQLQRAGWEQAPQVLPSLGMLLCFYTQRASQRGSLTRKCAQMSGAVCAR